MDEKEQYQRKQQARLDEWKAELDKMRAKAAEASADVRLKWHAEIEQLQGKVDDLEQRLSALRDTSGEAWGSLREGIDSAWESLKSGFSDAAAKFRK